MIVKLMLISLVNDGAGSSRNCQPWESESAMIVHSLTGYARCDLTRYMWTKTKLLL